MPKMIYSKYGYEPPEYVKADAELEKWLKKKKEENAHVQSSEEAKGIRCD